MADEASTAISGATFENPDATFEELAESLMYKGKKVFDHKMDAAETGYTYYMAAVLPVNFMQVYPISEGVAEEIFTDKAEQKGLTFEITAAADGPETGHVTVVPSNNEDQYVFDCVPLSQWKSWSDEERMANWVKRYGVYFNIGQRVYKGEQAKTDMELYPNTEYIAFAFGYDNGGTTTEFFSKTFTTPALADPSGLELDVKYYDLTYNTVKVDVTPNSDDIFYFVGLAPTQGFNIETYAKELEDDIQYTLNYMMDMSGHENYVVAEDVYEKCLRGAQTGMNPYHLGLPNYLGLEAGTSYTFYWFAVSTDTGECVKKESIPDFIVTPVMYGGTATVSVEVMGFYDQNEAHDYVDPEYFSDPSEPRVVLPIEITGMSDDAVEVWYGFSGGANFEEVTDEWLFTYGIGGFIQTQWGDIDKVMYRQNEHYEDYVWFFFAAKDKNGVFGPITRIGIDTPEGGQGDIEELKAFYEEHKDNMY